MTMIEVFKTNVSVKKEAKRIINRLENKFTTAKINFDLEDCDKILRIAGTTPAANRYIMTYLRKQGYNCEILD